MEERLQKLMAQAGLGSRRENEKVIAAGQVRVNGRIAKLGDKANLETDRVEVNGRRLKLRANKNKLVYIALNKPKGVISSLEDELGKGRRTVRDLIPLPGHIYPVGRLDKQSTGLILMTNDGDLAHKLTHPRYGHEKTYHVTIEGKISPETLNEWRRGVKLDGRKTAPAKIKVATQGTGFTLLEIIMREGRKRQIRRVASILGHSVTRLERGKIGPLALGQLKQGDWRHLTAGEVSALKRAVKSGKTHPQRKRKPRRPDKRRRKNRD